MHHLDAALLQSSNEAAMGTAHLYNDHRWGSLHLLRVLCPGIAEVRGRIFPGVGNDYYLLDIYPVLRHFYHWRADRCATIGLDELEGLLPVAQGGALALRYPCLYFEGGGIEGVNKEISVDHGADERGKLLSYL